MRPLNLALVAVATLALVSCTLPPDRAPSLPVFPTLRRLDGPSASVSDSQGRVRVVYVWATWCGPCSQLSPVLDRLVEKYSTKDVEFYAVNVRESDSAVSNFLKAHPKKMPVYMDSEGVLAAKIGSTVLPIILVVSPSGEIHERIEGVPEDAFERLDKSIAEAGAE